MALERIYGRHPVAEAVRAGRRPIRRLWAADRVALPEGAGPAKSASAQELQLLCGSPEHQGLVAEVNPFPYADPTTLLSGQGPTLVIALDQIQDPRNLGAICRSAEVAGADGVVIPSRRAAAVTPAVCKASAGAVEHLAIARVTNLASWLERAKDSGAWVHGASASAETDYDEADLSGPVVLVVGGEEKGLRPRVAQTCDVLVRIPQHGRVESLNAAGAATILIFEARRQRRKGTSRTPGPGTAKPKA